MAPQKFEKETEGEIYEDVESRLLFGFRTSLPNLLILSLMTRQCSSPSLLPLWNAFSPSIIAYFFSYSTLFPFFNTSLITDKLSMLF